MTPVPADDSRPSVERTDTVEPIEPQECRVYVGNLSWAVRSEDLRDHMMVVGDVLRANVFEDYQGRSRGCGIVAYKDEETAKRAIKELTDTQLKDRPIFVREDREETIGKYSTGGRSRGRPSYGGSRGGFGGNGGGGGGGGGNTSAGCRQVFVSNLPYKTSWQDLKDLFRGCGEVVRADVMAMADGRSKGMGTVLFTSVDDAQRAVESFNNYDLEGRSLMVRYDRSFSE